MENINENKMGILPIKRLLWNMGLPMIFSMILQALYNVVDSIFVANMGPKGEMANQALTYAFPIQILIIGIGVGTGVGINALLSKKLGENDKKSVNKIAGNGIFLLIVIYLIFLLFGLFCSEWFISLFANNTEIKEMASSYLKICSCLSIGSIGFAIYERFLQSTGKTMYSTIAQISGAAVNIILDYVFIFPCNMSVEGAAYATIIGQITSLVIAMLFHYLKNKEISEKISDIKPDKNIIKGVYKIGLSAAIMQCLLAVMMAGMNKILSLSRYDSDILVGSFGIYYKIQQVALFSSFGLSNTIITILSYNYGKNNIKRSKDCIKYGIIDSLIVTAIITILFEVLAYPLAYLFSLSGQTSDELIKTCQYAIRIGAIGYIFMGISVAIQGVLQAFRYSTLPLITALLRLIIFVLPFAILFCLSSNALHLVWFAFPIAEVLTSIISVVILKLVYKEKI